MIVAGNWKMNLELESIESFIKVFAKNYKKEKVSSEVIFLPPYPFISLLANSFSEKKISIGAQNVHFENNGPYTGQISAPMLSSLNCKYVLIGHSEYRNVDNEKISERIKISIKNNLTPILCCGESIEIKKEKKTLDFLKDQLDTATNLLSDDEVQKIIIAYEPIWSIGTGSLPINEEIKNIIYFIKDYLNKKNNSDQRVLYGGSCNEKNVKNLSSIENLDGFLIGGASTNPESFFEILKQIEV